MNKSLRDEVEALAENIRLRGGNYNELIAHELKVVIARHPPADGVVTDSEVIAARQEFERKLRELCDSFGNEVHYETTGRMHASPASVNGKFIAIRELVRTYVFASNKAAMAQARECDKRWAADGVVVPMAVVAFLNGSGPLEGVWFGDAPSPDDGPFWWRRHLPKVTQASAILSEGKA